MRRTGILGGTFNPVHIGHVFIGCAAFEAFGLDRVLLLPCSVSPFKLGAPMLAPGCDRLEMVRLSVTGDPRFEACALDVERGGVSYAVDTVRLLRQRCPDDQLFFIIGADSLAGLDHWHRADEMLALCNVITVGRPGFDLEATLDGLAFSDSVKARLRAHAIGGRLCDVSSTEIRRRIAEGRSIRYLVCPDVEAYIRDRGLYAGNGETKL